MRISLPTNSMSRLNVAASEYFHSLRKNPVVLYSVLLVVSVTFAIFGNTYYSIQKFEESTNSLLLNKASLIEKTIAVFSEEYLSAPEALRGKMNRLKGEEQDISSITIATRLPEGEGFINSVSTDEGEEGKEVNSVGHVIAWESSEGSAFLSSENGERFWNVIRRIEGSDGKRLGLVFVRLSLAENDAFIQQTIMRVYGVTVLALLFVLLLLLNHLRFSRYAIRANRLEEVDRMKDDFISMASHELRSPITILRGYVDLIGDGMRTKISSETLSEEREYLANMESTLGRLGTLVEDLLEVSRLEQNRVPFEITSFDLSEVIRPMARDYALQAKEKGLELVFHDEGVLPRVSADIERTKQIVANLLSNAIKYTKQGKINILLKEDRGRAVVTVADTGFGISPEGMTQLFGKFARIRTSENEKIAGTGLGLWIAREMARKMGGDIMAESIQGVGSHFSLYLKKG